LARRDCAQARAAHVHQRRDYVVPGEAVQPATFAALSQSGERRGVGPPVAEQHRRADAAPLASDAAPLAPLAPNRLDLARWLVSSDNPLTARVLVNRLWQHYFAKGLVETENDF